MPPRLHVQFAAGLLEDDLSSRVGAAAENAAEVARRDLDRYYALLRAELARVALADDEATIVIAACKSWYVATPDDARLLWIEVDDYLGEQLAEAARPDGDRVPVLDAAARAALVAKLRNLTPGQAQAVVDAVERYWCAVPGERTRAELGIPATGHRRMLREVGLVRD